MTTQQTNEIELPELNNQPGAPVPQLAGAAALPFLGHLKVKLTAQLGQTEISVSELTSLKLGSTLALDTLVNQPINLLAEGHVVAQGTLVAVGDNFGVRITALTKIA